MTTVIYYFKCSYHPNCVWQSVLSGSRRRPLCP